MIVNTKKVKKLVDKALKGCGVYAGMIENTNGQTGYCINTNSFRIFVNCDYADNEFKAILTSIMGFVPILGEQGQFFYNKETDEIMEQEILYSYEDFNNGAEKAFLTQIKIDKYIAVAGCQSVGLKAFSEEYTDIVNASVALDFNEMPKRFLKKLINSSVLIIKSEMFEVDIFSCENDYFEEVAKYLVESGFVRNSIERMLKGEGKNESNQHN